MIPAGIYIHIPFCAVKCMYCDFYSIADRNTEIHRFVKAITNEINRCNVDVSDLAFDTIFIGGGTPSLLEANSIESILNALDQKYDLKKITEITIEVNPGEAPFEKLKDFTRLGINRLSMGVQSLEPDLLKFLTRIHTVSQVFETYDHARSAGFNNINCDLIYGIPEQSRKMWIRDLKRIMDLQPEHISAYMLTVEKGTELYQLVHNEDLIMPPEKTMGDWFLETHGFLETGGYSAYEISNFSKTGFECEHNLHYWRIQPYLAFGPSAHGFDGQNRWNNSRSLDHYLKQIEKGVTPISNNETLNKTELINEMIGFGLRMREGINLNQIPKEFIDSFQQKIFHTMKKWNGCILMKKNRVHLTKSGMAFADSIAIDLIN